MSADRVRSDTGRAAELRLIGPTLRGPFTNDERLAGVESCFCVNAAGMESRSHPETAGSATLEQPEPGAADFRFGPIR